MEEINEIVIAMTGSIHYENVARVKHTLFKIRENLGKSLIKIASCGNSYGADKIIKKNALEFDFDYIEYTDYWKDSNIYSIQYAYNVYNKQKHGGMQTIRNKKLAVDANYLIYFGDPIVHDDNWLIDLIKQFKLQNKKYLKID